MSRNEAWLADLILQDTSILAYGRVKNLDKAAALVAAERVNADTAAKVIDLHRRIKALHEDLGFACAGLSAEARRGLQLLAEEPPTPAASEPQ